MHVWGGDGSEPKFGTKVALDALEALCAWDTESTRGFTSNESAILVGTEFDAGTTSVVYEQDGETCVSAVDAERMLSIVGRDDLAPVAAEVKSRLAAVVERVLSA